MITHDALAILPIINPTTGPMPSAPAQPSAAVPPDASPIRLACVEVCNFRRLAKPRPDLDETIMVLRLQGPRDALSAATNSGKRTLPNGLPGEGRSE
jgi:hypothetical protein